MFDQKEYGHLWYLRNREKTIERSRLWRQNHPERARELARQHARRYREKYPERHREANRHHWKEHIDDYRARSRQWYYRNIDKAHKQNKEWKKANRQRIRERERCKRRDQGIPVFGSEEYREKFRRMWRDPEYVRKQMEARSVKPNKTEMMLEEWFKKHELPFKFVGDGKVILGGKLPDFINYNGGKQIIELFGDYWHEPEEEEERKKIFAEFGYDTLIIWEHELKDESALLNKVESWLEG